MAKRRRATVTSIAPYRFPAPKPTIIRVSAPAAKKSRRRGRSGGSSGAAFMSSERTGAIVGAALLGFLDKAGTKVPTVPMLGRAGTLGVAAYFIGKHTRSPSVSHAATGFLAIAVYELMRDGTIAGVDGDVSTV